MAAASLPALGPWAPPSRTGPLARKYLPVSLTVDLYEGNRIISFKKFISPQPVGGPSKGKIKSGALGRECRTQARRTRARHRGVTSPPEVGQKPAT